MGKLTLKIKIMNTNKILIGIGILASALVSIPFIAGASTLYFPITSQTAVATSTLSYMTAGTGTTTPVYDAYSSGTQKKIDLASLFVQATASSTNTKYSIAFEYSQNGVDWYQDGSSNFQLSTTTGATNVSTANSVYFNFASSTLGGVVSATAPENKIINVSTPVRFVRAVISLPSGSTNGAVWAQFVPAQQVTGS